MMPNALTNVNYVYYNMLNLKLICSVLETKGIAIICFLEKQNPVGSTGMLLLKIQIQKDMKRNRVRERGKCVRNLISLDGF